MKGIVLGAGEVGKSLHRVLMPYFETAIVDVGQRVPGRFEVMHVCYPYHPEFVYTTVKYAEQYGASYVVIHSTVPAGTTRRVQEELGEQFVVHAPVEGRHPDLTKSMLVWEKPLGFVGELHDPRLHKLISYFKSVGITAKVYGAPENTEVGKILSTSFLGLLAIFARMANRICEENGADYDQAIRDYTAAYNKLYAAMGAPQFTRPILLPSEEPLGGHCVKPNLELLPDEHTQALRQFILDNELLSRDD